MLQSKYYQEGVSREEDYYIREHEYYYTPGTYITRKVLENMDLSSGNTDTLRELARFFYHRMVWSEDYVETKFKGENAIPEKEDFYKQLWELDYVPGYSPLEKGAYIIREMLKQQNNKDGVPKLEDPVDFRKIKSDIPDKEIVESPELNKVLDTRLDMDKFTKKIDLMRKICLVESFGKSFEIKKTVSEKRVQNSDVFKLKRLVEYGELPNVLLHERLLPNFNAKMLTKDLVVNTPIRKEESKQKIIMLVDASGSMNEEYKQEWVLTILADRLRYCIKQECEIYFSYFLTKNDINKAFKFTHIYDEKTALELFKTYNMHPRGGDTEIGDVVDTIRTEILDNKKLFNLQIDLSIEQPEILIINDGNDDAKCEKLSWKTNAITIGQNNSQLKDLCEKTEGKYVRL
jgi:hypothetical protein